ncbi:Npc2-like protein [Metarhizium album ARSEF 1941]|uniref:Phosphatidylglycerol/phosphatidylinositol transfer protein n=1 Tax=Metarhizium album (strain ARSEF 1941) TaxID=1081103 RepID=A0A0B2WZB9_METAS|nr:Npc2-like protein [Metarhizium album ARSEF 1941]KHN98742.1 Npc2-like protein [Metarhizium album ARSEF 1941]
MVTADDSRYDIHQFHAAYRQDLPGIYQRGLRLAIQSRSCPVSPFVAVNIFARNPGLSRNQHPVHDMHALLLFLLPGILGAANAASIMDCGSTAKDLEFHVAGCADADPACVFSSRHNASVEASFTAPAPFQSAKIDASASVGIIQLDFPLEPAEACGNWGLQCPAQAGSRQTLKVEIPVQSSYPKIKVGVKLRLIAQTGETLICKSFPVRIT